MRMWVALGLTAAIAAVRMPAIASYPKTTLSAAHVTRRGSTLEVHFEFDGNAPRLNLSAHGTQLWIDMSQTLVAIPPRPLFGYETAPISFVRMEDLGGGNSRIVVEVIGKSDYAVARLKRELVLRVAKAGDDPNIAAPIVVRSNSSQKRALRVGPRIAASTPPGIPSAPAPHSESVALAPATEPISLDEAVAGGSGKLVIIDPGHGGYDPGTQSMGGIQEKDLALQIAIRLKTALEARGIRAELTRVTDTFIALPERTRIANRAGADLFVSIHLNSSPNAQTTGIEVYYLNNTTDHSTMRLARIENGEAAGYGAPNASNLNYILTDLRQNYKASEAASLARMIDAQTVSELDSQLGIDVHALGAKMGPFYVLVGAHMPAVLVECGFLSNPVEAERMLSPRYQDLLAGGIARAVVHYFNADLAVGNL
jgi:N-acetylmuramoyl-L-alanine amidase